MKKAAICVAALGIVVIMFGTMEKACAPAQEEKVDPQTITKTPEAIRALPPILLSKMDADRASFQDCDRDFEDRWIRMDHIGENPSDDHDCTITWEHLITWFSISPASITIPPLGREVFQVYCDRTGMDPGSYSGIVDYPYVYSEGGGSGTVPHQYCMTVDPSCDIDFGTQDTTFYDEWSSPANYCEYTMNSVNSIDWLTVTESIYIRPLGSASFLLEIQ